MDKNDKNIIVLQIISDVQNKLSPSIIQKKYSISKYEYYKIMDEYKLKQKTNKKGPSGPTGPKNTKFKQILYGTQDEKTCTTIVKIENFITDCKNRVTINELMSKYNLTLYQVRELRILHHLKIK